ncbi:hypothetical protein CtesDRAFT_PD3206 [Comamonas testosteroni KF-1]|uniref:Uncharacterized protein n=1 Tax=Comamonas testosteroni (strain DSM 14576 / KF-1) TaxID=399795 RepID=B7X0S8_COMTK|nr:hypothetical protein CtesDRAFT_PD3206 [Comamonas testosteroni KF-1]
MFLRTLHILDESLTIKNKDASYIMCLVEIPGKFRNVGDATWILVDRDFTSEKKTSIY